MRILFFILISLVFSSSQENSCNNSFSYQEDVNSIKIKISEYKAILDTCRTPIANRKIALAAGAEVQEALLTRLIPAWYGTGWDFNGYTAVPQQGKIACGYFVSTLLQHAGFKLNRYRLAQKDAASEINALCCGEKVYKFYNTSRDRFLIQASQLKDGLYVIGLDFHVGFLQKEREELFFIHSNYIGKAGVMKEKAAESETLDDSKTFILTSITGNETLMKKWIRKEEIVIR